MLLTRGILFQFPDKLHHKPASAAHPISQSSKNELIEWIHSRIVVQTVSQYGNVIEQALEKVRFTFEELDRHIGEASGFYLKTQLSNSLSLLFEAYLKNSTLEHSEQVVVALKLNEGIGACSEGFLNRVEEIIHRFQRPQNFSSLIYEIRFEIVDKVANQLTSEVHARNRVFSRAHKYGVSAFNSNDFYTGALAYDQIDTALQSAFNKEFNLFHIIEETKTKFRQELVWAGYTGPSDSEYGISGDTLEKLEQSLLKFLDHNTLIDVFLDVKNQLKDIETKIEKNYAEQLFRKKLIEALSSYKNNLLQKNYSIWRPRLDALDSIPLESLLMWYEEFKHFGVKPDYWGLWDANKIYKNLNSHYNSAFEEYNTLNSTLKTSLHHLRELFSEYHEMAHQLLFVRSFSETADCFIIKDINWPQIFKIIHEELISSKYFQSTAWFGSAAEIAELLKFFDHESSIDFKLQFIKAFLKKYPKLEERELPGLIKHIFANITNIMDFSRLLDICIAQNEAFTFSLFENLLPNVKSFSNLMEYFDTHEVQRAYYKNFIFEKYFNAILNLEMNIDDIGLFLNMMIFVKYNLRKRILESFYQHHANLFSYDFFNCLIETNLFTFQDLTELMLLSNIEIELEDGQFNHLFELILKDQRQSLLFGLVKNFSIHIDNLDKLLIILPKINSTRIWNDLLLMLPLHLRHLRHIQLQYKQELLDVLGISHELNQIHSSGEFEQRLLALPETTFSALMISCSKTSQYIQASHLLHFCIDNAMKYKNYPLLENLTHGEEISPFLILKLLNQVSSHKEDIHFFNHLILKLNLIQNKNDFLTFELQYSKHSSPIIHSSFYQTLQAYPNFNHVQLVHEFDEALTLLKQIQFDEHILKLNDKYLELHSRYNSKTTWFKNAGKILIAYETMFILHQQLTQFKFEFLEDKDVEKFKSNCLLAIQEAEPILQQQRGLGFFISYILLIIHHLKLLLGFESSLTKSDALIQPLKQSVMSIESAYSNALLSH
jgi:hypothetical protein